MTILRRAIRWSDDDENRGVLWERCSSDYRVQWTLWFHPRFFLLGWEFDEDRPALILRIHLGPFGLTRHATKEPPA